MRSFDHYLELARKAMDFEWGSEEQIEADNEFFETVRKDGLWSEKFECYCHKATVVERVLEGLRLRHEAGK